MTTSPSTVLLVGLAISLWGASFLWLALVGSAISCAVCPLPLWPLAMLLVGLVVVAFGSALWFRSRSPAAARCRTQMGMERGGGVWNLLRVITPRDNRRYTFYTKT